MAAGNASEVFLQPSTAILLLQWTQWWQWRDYISRWRAPYTGVHRCAGDLAVMEKEVSDLALQHSCSLLGDKLIVFSLMHWHLKSFDLWIWTSSTLGQRVTSIWGGHIYDIRAKGAFEWLDCCVPGAGCKGWGTWGGCCMLQLPSLNEWENAWLMDILLVADLGFLSLRYFCQCITARSMVLFAFLLQA